MTVKYINCKGDTYYLHEGKTKKGTSKYFFSMKQDGQLVKSTPQGYEIYENPNGSVFLRRIVPKRVTNEEVSIVEDGIRPFSKLKYFKVDIKGNNITVYLPDQDFDSLLDDFSVVRFAKHSKLEELLRRHSTYSPMMRFILVEDESRKFIVERMCFLGPEDDWLFLEGPDNLSKLVKKYCMHLGKNSFFELI